MKTKTKKDLNMIIDELVNDYNEASLDDKGKVLANLIKGINMVKEVENQTIDNQIKRKRIKLDQEKLELEQIRIELDKEKINLDREKINTSSYSDDRKFRLEDSRLEFEVSRFNTELKRSKKDKIFTCIVKGLEIGVPLIIYGGLSVLALKATYKDDVRVPSETWSFIRNVSKK